MSAFLRHIGIDYSGAQTPDASLKGLRVYQAERDGPPLEVLPPPSPRKYWTRRGVAEWLIETLSESVTGLEQFRNAIAKNDLDSITSVAQQLQGTQKKVNDLESMRKQLLGQ